MASPKQDGAAVDAKLAAWRQGDCVLGEQWFLYRAHPAHPLTEPAKDWCDPNTGNAEAEVPGLVVLTQTCDLVRRCEDRPFVELAPLYALSVEDWQSAARGRRPGFAVLPALADRRLVADLDRVMTVEKPIVAEWVRVEGCRSDDERRQFALALARKRARTAFPDDFVEWLSPLQKRLVEKHDKSSQEGRALRSLREIRVRAAPAWDAPDCSLTLFFIRDAGAESFEDTAWDALLEGWLGRVPRKGRFVAVDGLVQTLDELSASDYVESDLLDLGHLSERTG